MKLMFKEHPRSIVEKNTVSCTCQIIYSFFKNWYDMLILLAVARLALIVLVVFGILSKFLVEYKLVSLSVRKLTILNFLRVFKLALFYHSQFFCYVDR